VTDLDERAWWVFLAPGGKAYVPAATEQLARSVLASNCYPGAPVDSWPLEGTRFTSRFALSRELLRERSEGEKPWPCRIRLR